MTVLTIGLFLRQCLKLAHFLKYKVVHALGESPVLDLRYLVHNQDISDKGKPRAIWGRKATGPDGQDSRVAEGMMTHLKRYLANRVILERSSSALEMGAFSFLFYAFGRAWAGIEKRRQRKPKCWKRSLTMKKFIAFALIRMVLLVACADLVAAEINPNGFPSGDHYNLNIHGKKASYSCSEQEYDIYGEPVYGNSVFVPENGQGSIFVESGKGKKAAAVTELQVTDPCTFDGDGATIKLPPNNDGYRVYARVLAKPTDEPYIGLESSLYMVQDEDGNDLLYLGLVTDQGFETPSVSVTRKKGKSKAVDISGMFQWSGTVCYFEEPADGYESSNTVCCVDADEDGVLDECSPAAVDSTTDLATCDEEFTELTTYCKSFNAEWIFNAADYITMLMESNNNGVKLMQIRFYPN